MLEGPTDVKHGERRIILTNFYAEMDGGEFLVLRRPEHHRRRGDLVHVCLLQDGALVSRLRGAGCEVCVRPERMDCGPRSAWVKRLTFVPWLARWMAKVRPAYVMTDTLRNCHSSRGRGLRPSPRCSTETRPGFAAAVIVALAGYLPLAVWGLVSPDDGRRIANGLASRPTEGDAT